MYRADQHLMGKGILPEILPKACGRYLYYRVDRTSERGQLLKYVVCVMGEPGPVCELVMYGMSAYGLLRVWTTCG